MRARPLTSRLPRPLLLLLAAVALLGLAWSLLVPPWQAPDENAHFGYAQAVAEGEGIPGTEEGQIVLDRPVPGATDAVHAKQVAFNRNLTPVWSETLFDQWRAGPDRASG